MMPKSMAPNLTLDMRKERNGRKDYQQLLKAQKIGDGVVALALPAVPEVLQGPFLV
jgi:hypothetical protein